MIEHTGTTGVCVQEAPRQNKRPGTRYTQVCSYVALEKYRTYFFPKTSFVSFQSSAHKDLSLSPSPHLWQILLFLTSSHWRANCLCGGFNKIAPATKALRCMALLEQVWLCRRKYVTGDRFWGFKCSSQAHWLAFPTACQSRCGNLSYLSSTTTAW